MTNTEQAVADAPRKVTGEWWVKPLRGRGYARRPHFYANGSDVSFCLYDRRGENDLQWNPETGLTVTDDPRLGEPQYRRGCGVCKHDLAHTIGRTESRRAPLEPYPAG
ncbi:hypothetical protein ACFVAJ_17905 [Agromyces sp. NPDC057679]|uniref:hypothetical protein n=1 Tax=Agromyces sp. NPDC057679 TaxID=3346207 RepID=UPI00366B8F14